MSCSPRTVGCAGRQPPPHARNSVHHGIRHAGLDEHAAGAPSRPLEAACTPRLGQRVRRPQSRPRCEARRNVAQARSKRLRQKGGHGSPGHGHSAASRVRLAHAVRGPQRVHRELVGRPQDRPLCGREHQARRRAGVHPRVEFGCLHHRPHARVQAASTPEHRAHPQVYVVRENPVGGHVPQVVGVERRCLVHHEPVDRLGRQHNGAHDQRNDELALQRRHDPWPQRPRKHRCSRNPGHRRCLD
mmetsp:Transcript_7991/g.31530  ORF Transcript_7991/g.31530 Transcript_7991/m.31530 type:complete len:244 (-) Transcript_7991:401-1132(-)